jgi:hypothetical protein
MLTLLPFEPNNMKQEQEQLTALQCENLLYNHCKEKDTAVGDRGETTQLGKALVCIPFWCMLIIFMPTTIMKEQQQQQVPANCTAV